MPRLFTTTITMLVLSLALCAQTANQMPPSQAPPQLPPEGMSQAPAQLPPGNVSQAAPPMDSARQMQLDLDQMDSLVNNMAAQVSFISDTNMSILLNTNVRLWSVLLRDLRLQLQQQQKAARSAPAATPRK